MKKKKIEFIDKQHEIMHDFYTTFDNKNLSKSEIIEIMKDFIAEDENFLDPYLICSDIHLEKNNIQESDRYIITAYKQQYSGQF